MNPGHGARVTNSDELASRVHAMPGKEQALGDEVEHRRGTTEAAIDGDQGVGGLRKSNDAGERTKAPGPGRAKAARAETSFRREP